MVKKIVIALAVLFVLYGCYYLLTAEQRLAAAKYSCTQFLAIMKPKASKVYNVEQNIVDQVEIKFEDGNQSSCSIAFMVDFDKLALGTGKFECSNFVIKFVSEDKITENAYFTPHINRQIHFKCKYNGKSMVDVAKERKLK